MTTSRPSAPCATTPPWAAGCADPSGRLAIDRAKLKAEALLDGKFRLSTSDPELSAEDVAKIGHKNLEAERAFGLDRPLPARYTQFLSRPVRGNLSSSLYTRRPVRTDIAASSRQRWSLRRLRWCWPSPLGLLTARGRGAALRVGLVGSASVPAFLLTLLLLIVFYARLR
jgi:ABC-type dipeptide/oligopeptide/nickel transport system permease component